MIEPKISIIIPCFNAEKYVGEAISSALDQSYQNIEVVVVDNASGDNSLEVINKFGSKIVIKSCNKLGGNYARNMGLMASSGEYIKFLDADDYISGDLIENELRALLNPSKRSKELVVSGSFTFLTDEKKVNIHWPKKGARVVKGSDLCLKTILLHTPPVGSPLYEKRVLEKIGCFDVRLSNRQDIDLFVRYVATGVRPVFSGVYGYYYRQHSSDTRISKGARSGHAESQMKMIRSHFLLGLELKDRLLRRYFMSATAKRAWIYGREFARLGDARIAKEYFQEARDIAPYECIAGSIFYRITCLLLGPIRSELVLEKIKSALRIDWKRVEGK
jgi:glycosyltransferase involved in cell wall biosynthesis